VATDICNAVLSSLKGEQPADIRLVVDLALDAFYEFQPLTPVEILVPEYLKEATLIAVPTLRERDTEAALGTYRNARFTLSDTEIELTIEPLGDDNEA
jgi:hypothetical protein